MWQIIVIILGSVIAGTGLGLVTVYLYFSVKNTRYSRLRLEPGKGPYPVNGIGTPYIEKKLVPIVESENRVVGSKMGESEDTALREQPKIEIKSEIYQELEHNLIIATSSQDDSLVSFVTTCWDNNGLYDDPELAKHQEAVGRIYADIRLANMAISLANRGNLRTESFNHFHEKIRLKIAEQVKFIFSIYKTS